MANTSDYYATKIDNFKRKMYAIKQAVGLEAAILSEEDLQELHLLETNVAFASYDASLTSRALSGRLVGEYLV